MSRTSCQHLVYLSEKDCEKEILNRSGVQRLRTSVEWFEDHRFTPQHNARYLQKLETLRADVIAREQVNLSQTFSRLKPDGYGGRGKTGDVITRPASKPKASTSRETYPERFKRLQKQRNELLEKRRHLPDRSQKIAPLQGEKMINLPASEPAKDSDGRSTGSGQTSQSTNGRSPADSLPGCDVIFLPKARPGRAVGATDGLRSANGVASLQHQSSIPNLDRKSRKQPKPLLSLNDYELRRTDSFIRQMALHHKDAKGLYKGANRRHLLRADMDELDLTPDAFKFDVLSEKQLLNSLKQYSPPIPTPVFWQTPVQRNRTLTRDAVAKEAEADGDVPKDDRRDEDEGNVRCEEREGTAGLERSAESRLYEHVDYPLAVRPLHPALLRTPASVYTPTNRGYIRVLETANQRASRSHATQRPGWDELRISGTSSDGSRSNQRQQMADFMKEHPNAVSVKTETGDVILVNRSNTALNSALDRTSGMTYANTPEYTRTTTPTEVGCRLNEVKVSLVVEMPNIVLNPPTPTRQQDRTDDDIVHLRKTFRQNELREKELAKLLDDVKELNQMAERKRHHGNTNASL